MELSTQKREILGRKVSTLRKQGLIPAELYGHGVENTHLSVAARDFAKVLEAAGESTVVDLLVDGEKHPVLIYNVAYHPITDEVNAVDFYKVRMDEKITTAVEIDFMGESPALRKGGIVVKAVNELEVEAFPQDLPHDIKVDLSKLENIGDVIKVKDLPIPANVAVEADPDTVVVSITEKLSEEEDLAQAAPVDVSAIATEADKKKAETEGAEAAPAADGEAKAADKPAK